MDSVDDFTGVLDLTDYTRTIDADNYEVTFDFPSTNSMGLKELSIFLQSGAGSSSLSWDVYVKDKNNQYVKTGSISDDFYVQLANIENSVENSDNLSIKVKYNTHGYTIENLDAESFSNRVSIMSVTAYGGERTIPEPEPEPEPTPEPKPTPEPEQEIPVPKTSSKDSGSAPHTPDTGASTENHAMTTVVPIATGSVVILIAGLIGKYIKNRSRGRVDFNH